MDWKAEIQQLKDTLINIDYDYLKPERTRGCSEERVQALDRYAACGRLPELYREFLLAMGEYIDGTYMGSYLFTCKYLDEIQEEGHAMAKEYQPEVPSDAYFFATFDYVDYFYFRTSEPDDNPPVYMCSAGRVPFMLHKTLRRFFMDEMGEVDEHGESFY
jgi:hypothetical protein